MNNSPQKPVHPLDQPPTPVQPPPERAVVRRVEFPQVTPYLCYTILVLNIVIFLLDMLSGHRLTMLGAKDNQMIVSGQFWRLFTPMFLHGGVFHLGLNCYSLYWIGPRIERSFGHWRFLAIYILSGIAGTVASFAFGPYPSIGASGALFGLIGALIPMLYLNRKIFANTQQQITNIIVVIAMNLVYGLSAGGIDNWGHIGGLVGGLILAWPTTPRYVLRLSTPDSARIDDESMPFVAWLVYSVSAFGLAVITFLVIYLRSLSTGS
ncbi:MAG: rhomboid family intramembrane serine protease [Anaerolineae bacterium]|nr:rhomboid family intramembrane serine protease [Anaerolineae bacterium]